MAGRRSQTTLGLDSEYGIEGCKYLKQTFDILGTTKIENIYVIRLDRSAVQDSGKATDNDELGFAFLSRSQQPEEFILLHSERE